MGRYSSDVVSSTTSFNQQQSPMMGNWPTEFNNAMVSIDLNGTIIEDKLLQAPSDVVLIPGVLDAIRSIRLKKHKLFVLSDQPGITKGLVRTETINESWQHMMQLFGQAGIMSIDGFLYNTSDLRNDEYAKPNLGMIKRAENELPGNLKFKGGFHVGDSMDDLKMAQKASMTPVLVLTGNGKDTLKDLDKHSNKELKRKTKVYQTLQQFADSL